MKSLCIRTISIFCFCLIFVVYINAQIIPLNELARQKLAIEIAQNGIQYPYSFVVLADPEAKSSDTGNSIDPYFIQILDEIKDSPIKPKFVISCGDNVENIELEYQLFYDTVSRWMDSTNVAFFSVPGNHDIYSGSSNSDYWFEYIDGDPSYIFDYYFDYGQERFISINNVPNYLGSGYKISTQQLDTIEEWLEDNANRSYTFVHKPLIQSGTIESDPGYFELHKMHLKFNIRSNFSGHHHSYSLKELDGVNCLVIGSCGGGVTKKFENTRTYRLEPSVKIWDYQWMLVTVQECGAYTTEIHILGKEQSEPLNETGITANDFTRHLFEMADERYLTGKMENDQIIYATDKIETNIYDLHGLEIEDQVNISFRAGQEIVLNPGFEIELGSTLFAKTGPILVDEKGCIIEE